MSDLNAVSAGTVRWLFDDANAAFHQLDHPCHGLSKTQGAIPWDEWQLPVPFLGREMRRGLVFLGFNPSYGGKPEIDSPRGGTEFDAYYNYWASVFDGSSVEGRARLYGRYLDLGRSALGSNFALGVDALVVDAIPYRSAKQGEAWSDDVWKHVRDRYTRAVLVDCSPRIIVTCGAWALWCLFDLFPQVEGKRPAPFRLRDVVGKDLSLTTDWGSIIVLPLPHLSSAFGISNEDFAQFARLLRVMASRER
ncbi:MAG: hypothetical protein ABSE84_16685 [Isosphaeraceae bacterium]